MPSQPSDRRDRPTPPRVLVVDDESTIRMALRRFFTRMGWEVEEAANGQSALSMIIADGRQRQTQPYSLVVSDLRMPGLSGIELHDQLKAELPELLPRLIFSTGDLVSDAAAAFVRDTNCVVLHKPFELSALRGTVERLTRDD